MRTIDSLFVAVVIGLAAPAFAAGDVTAVLVGRTLTITGDGGSNSISITSGGATDALTVSPASGTTLNGGAAATFQHVHGVALTMGAGDDRVEFNYVKVRGSVRLDLGDGNDQCYFTGATIRGRTIVRCGAGTDYVRTDAGAIFYGPVNIKGEAGNDEIQVVSAQFRERLHVEGGGDDDHVLLQSVTCTRTARVEATGNRGIDLVEVFYCQLAADLWVDLGPDDDRVRLLGCAFGRDVSVYGGAGRDDVLSIEAGNTFARLRSFGGLEEGEPPQ